MYTFVYFSNEARTGSSLNGSATKSTSQTSLKAGPITNPYPLQNEYIKNLQHQIYLLELEVEYLYPFLLN